MDSIPETKWKCPYCLKILKTKKTLTMHLITHDPDAKVNCEICGKVSKNRVALSVHMAKLHVTRERPSCDICHQTFFSPRTLRSHMDNIHATGERPRFSCSFPGCEKSYSNKRHVSRHVRTEHSDSRIRHTCTLCGKEFKRSQHLESHTATHTTGNPVRHTCTLCGKEFKRKRHLENHAITHTTGKAYNCAVCGKGFKFHGNMKVHEATHLEKSPKKFNCQHCSLSFFSKYTLQRHVRVGHENQLDFPCTLCDKKLTTAQGLKHHVEAIHHASTAEIHFCHKCEYQSHSKHNFNQHVRRHNAVKTQECYFCGKKFKYFVNLNRHCCKVHTLEKYVKVH